MVLCSRPMCAERPRDGAASSYDPLPPWPRAISVEVGLQPFPRRCLLDHAPLQGFGRTAVVRVFVWAFRGRGDLLAFSINRLVRSFDGDAEHRGEIGDPDFGHWG